MKYQSLGSKNKEKKEEEEGETEEGLKKKNSKIMKLKKSKNIGLNTKISNKFLMHDAETTIYENKLKIYR